MRILHCVCEYSILKMCFWVVLCIIFVNTQQHYVYMNIPQHVFVNCTLQHCVCELLQRRVCTTFVNSFHHIVSSPTHLATCFLILAKFLFSSSNLSLGRSRFDKVTLQTKKNASKDNYFTKKWLFVRPHSVSSLYIVWNCFVLKQKFQNIVILWFWLV